jgi:hypothetical protein
MLSDDHIEQLERRLGLDEERLDVDEARLDRDEVRLSVDEARLEDEAEEGRTNRGIAVVAVALGVVLVIAVTALVLSLAALRRDVHVLAHAAPDGSVSTAAIQDGAVTAPKLGGGSVGRAAVAHRAIGRAQLATHAVGTRAVGRNALTGAQIREGTLARVPSATRANSANRALDAAELGGLPPAAYLSCLVTVKAVTVRSAGREKGPLVARCPSGLRIVSGGTEVRGVASGVSILRSAPIDGQGWLGRAATAGRGAPRWRLVVRALCG